MDILSLFMIYLIPIILIGIIMEGLKYLLLKTLLKNLTLLWLKELIFTGITLIISAVVIIPFVIANTFTWTNYIQFLLICWLLSGKLYDIIKKKFFTPGGTT